MTKAMSSVRGKHAYIIQSTSKPVNDSIMELLICIDSLSRASAESITAVIPYFGYARQDRKAEGRQPITSKLVANLISVSGATKVITFDLHSPQIQGFFDIPTDNLKAIRILKDEIKKLNLKDLCIASPDFGGLLRARSFALKMGKDIPIATLDKIRYKKNSTKVVGVFGDVKGKNVIIVDDMIDTGGTIIQAIDIFLKQGAKQVILACTHGVFSNGAVKKLINSKVSKIFVTDTIESEKWNIHKKIKVVSIANFIADVIKANQSHTSVSLIYEKYNK